MSIAFSSEHPFPAEDRLQVLMSAGVQKGPDGKVLTPAVHIAG
jgi:hypothetical protein